MGAYAVDPPEATTIRADVVSRNGVFPGAAGGLLKEMLFWVDDDPDVPDAAVAGAEEDQISLLGLTHRNSFAVLERPVVLVA